MDDFAEDPPPRAPPQDAGRLVLDIDGYAGPLDLLLDLARAQKVDLRHISITALVRQYLDFIEKAKALKLTLAADYLVMAAWLAYLKSRLLLPEPAIEGEEDGAELAALLAFRLRQLEAMQGAAKKLAAHPCQYPRGAPEGAVTRTKTAWQAGIGDLLAAYGAIAQRHEAARYDPPEFDLASVDEAMERLARLLRGDAWTPLARLVPRRAERRGTLYARSSLACALAASLELTKQGRAELRQDGPFAPITLRVRTGA